MDFKTKIKNKNNKILVLIISLLYNLFICWYVQFKYKWVGLGMLGQPYK